MKELSTLIFPSLASLSLIPRMLTCLSKKWCTLMWRACEHSPTLHNCSVSSGLLKALLHPDTLLHRKDNKNWTQVYLLEWLNQFVLRPALIAVTCFSGCWQYRALCNVCHSAVMWQVTVCHGAFNNPYSSSWKFRTIYYRLFFHLSPFILIDPFLYILNTTI